MFFELFIDMKWLLTLLSFQNRQNVQIGRASMVDHIFSNVLQ